MANGAAGREMLTPYELINHLFGTGSPTVLFVEAIVRRFSIHAFGGPSFAQIPVGTAGRAIPMCEIERSVFIVPNLQALGAALSHLEAICVR